ncbi:hypothetical protein M8C21_017464, partial [Ambrosia artemisiifolia]
PTGAGGGGSWGRVGMVVLILVVANTPLHVADRHVWRKSAARNGCIKLQRLLLSHWISSEARSNSPDSVKKAIEALKGAVTPVKELSGQIYQIYGYEIKITGAMLSSHLNIGRPCFSPSCIFFIEVKIGCNRVRNKQGTQHADSQIGLLDHAMFTGFVQDSLQIPAQDSNKKFTF